MKCVLLLGFSTTGKSSVLREFRKKYGSAIDTLDTDEYISQSEGGHIYNVYLRHRDGHNTDPANQVIASRERECLRSAGPTTKPLLMAAGPFIPIRGPEWQEFLNRVNPACFYLQKDPEGVLTDLRRRPLKQLEENPDLASDPGFGCWDQGVTTEFRNGRWEEVDDASALAKIREIMNGVVPIYQQLALKTFTWRERATVEGQKRLGDAIRQELGL